MVLGASSVEPPGDLPRARGLRGHLQRRRRKVLHTQPVRKDQVHAVSEQKAHLVHGIDTIKDTLGTDRNIPSLNKDKIKKNEGEQCNYGRLICEKICNLNCFFINFKRFCDDICRCNLLFASNSVKCIDHNLDKQYPEKDFKDISY